MSTAGVPASPLLGSTQIATFVARGFLRFDEIVPRDLCAAALAEIEAGALPSSFQARRAEAAARWPGRSFHTVWQQSQGMGAIVRLPAVVGIIESLVGPRPIYDHHYAHTVEAGQRWSQPWHADAIIDTRPTAFDIQLFFFLHDTPRHMGGTMILPGSHLRRVNESDIARYQNFLGQLPTVCPAGSLLVCHHGIWHCGQPNLSNVRRQMLKVRLGPSVNQRRLWNVTDLRIPQVAATVADILNTPEPWHGNEGRFEIVNRIKLWRALTGDESFDIDYWLGRMGNPPKPLPEAGSQGLG
jgi:hypothetical protein